jgi:hypothetical protein
VPAAVAKGVLLAVVLCVLAALPLAASADPGPAPTSEPSQAGQLRDALLLARCQPAVGAFFNFELLDEDRLAGWQSGVLWRDGTEKPSYAAFREAVALVRSGRLDCAAVPGVAGAPLPPGKPRASSPGIR